MGLLGGLQIITCIWMYLILKVAYKVVTGSGAEDVRSDEDDTDIELEEEERRRRRRGGGSRTTNICGKRKKKLY